MLVEMPPRTIPLILSLQLKAELGAVERAPAVLGDQDVTVAEAQLGAELTVVRDGSGVGRAFRGACLDQVSAIAGKRDPGGRYELGVGPERLCQLCAPGNELLRRVRGGHVGDAVLEARSRRGPSLGRGVASTFCLSRAWRTHGGCEQGRQLSDVVEGVDAEDGFFDGGLAVGGDGAAGQLGVLVADVGVGKVPVAGTARGCTTLAARVLPSLKVRRTEVVELFVGLLAGRS